MPNENQVVWDDPEVKWDSAPASSQQSTPQSSVPPWLASIGQSANDAVQGVGAGALSTVYHGGDLIRRMLGMNRIINNPDVQANMNAPNSLSGKAGKMAEQTAEFFIPGDAETAVAGKLGQALPFLGKAAQPIANIAAGALSTGAVNKMQGGDFTTGAIGGAVGGALSEGAQAIAPSVAEAALGISRKARMHGRTPGAAALDELSGIAPETITKEARDKIGSLNSILETAASNTSATTKIDPAIDVVDKAMSKAMKENSTGLYQKLQLLRDQLTHDLFTGQPFPADRSATDILNLKRGVGSLTSSWTKEERKPIDAVIQGVYGQLDSKLDSLVPGADSINQRISSLIPVKNRAASEAAGAPIAQRMLHRVAAHTGAMAGPVAGAAIGYKEGGAPGALAGGAAGAALQEGATSPAVQMAIARILKNPSIPTTTAKGLVLQLLRGDQQ